MMSSGCLHIEADSPVPAGDDGQHHRWGDPELLSLPQRVPAAAGCPNARDIHVCGDKPILRAAEAVQTGGSLVVEKNWLLD
jgi:hypothetical protein